MQYVRHTLSNGVRVILVPMSESPTVTSMVLQATGSHFERKETNGISHFLEHLCFKGTVKRPTPRAIAEELDGMGSYSNAFTGEEYTGYFAKAVARNAGKIFDVVSDIFLNSTFPEDEIRKEKGVVTGEIDMYEDEPQSIVWDEVGSLLYGDQPAGRTILGPRENIKAFSREDFLKYREANYGSEGTLVVVSGNMNEKEILKLVENSFGGLSRKACPDLPHPKEMQDAPAVRLRTKETSQTHLVIASRAFKKNDPRSSALKLLAGVLGAGMSSRLFIKVREELGLGYYVSARNIQHRGFGVMTLFAGVNKDRLSEAVHAMLGEVRNLKNNGIPEGELRKVKELLIGNMYMGLERSDDLATFYGGTEILGLPLKTPEEKEKELRAVTAEEVLAVAHDVFKTETLNLAVVGPHKSEEKLLPLLSV